MGAQAEDERSEEQGQGCSSASSAGGRRQVDEVDGQGGERARGSACRTRRGSRVGEGGMAEAGRAVARREREARAVVAMGGVVMEQKVVEEGAEGRPGLAAGRRRSAEKQKQEAARRGSATRRQGSASRARGRDAPKTRERAAACRAEGACGSARVSSRREKGCSRRTGTSVRAGGVCRWSRENASDDGSCRKGVLDVAEGRRGGVSVSARRSKRRQEGNQGDAHTRSCRDGRAGQSERVRVERLLVDGARERRGSDCRMRREGGRAQAQGQRLEKERSTPSA